jgi:hypothetical protein
MNSQIHTSLLTGFVEEHIRAAAESRLLPEHRQSRLGRRRRNRPIR